MRFNYFLTTLFSFLLIGIILSFTFGKSWLDGETSLLVFGVIHFGGYLFFLLLPVELAFILHLPDHPPATLWLIALLTALAAQTLDYIIGRVISPYTLDKWIGEKRHRNLQQYIERYGDYAVFIFNLLPLSSPVVVLLAGLLRHPYSRVLLWSILGLIVKYSFLTIFFL